MKYALTILLAIIALGLQAQTMSKVVVRQEGYKENHGLRVVIGNKTIDSNSTGELLLEKEIDLTEPVFGMVVQKNSKYSGFWIEAGASEVIVKKKGFPQSLKVDGSISHGIYHSINHSPDNDTFIRNFLINKEHPIALDLLNSMVKFNYFGKEELEELYMAVSVENRSVLKEVKAYINTFGIAKIIAGREVLDFVAADENGTSFDTKDYRGKYLLLDFAATGCGPCWVGYPGMIKEVAKYDNLQVVTYNQDDEIATWNEIANKQNIELDWPVLWHGENKEEVFQLYDVNGWPLHFLISPEGKVLVSWYGSGNRLANFLEKFIK